MSDVEGVKSVIKKQLAKDRPTMDADYLREEILCLLGDIPCPGDSKMDRWEDRVEVFERAPEDDGRESGLRIFAAIRLFTRDNRYLVSVLESLNPADAGVYFATAHVSWVDSEKQRQARVEKAYAGSFDDNLRHRHMLWAQTFRKNELREALYACFFTVLGHELAAKPPAGSSGEPLQAVLPHKAEFPQPETE